jgi:uncharacterized membrane protein
MSRFVAAGMSFLLAVLWFDLMFDVQTRGHTGELLPPEVLTSISAYYRRVTTEAHPMNLLVSTVMMGTILAICAQIYQGRTRWWVGWGSLAIVCIGVAFTLTRTVPNAVRLGSATDSLAIQTQLARSIYSDHVFAFARMLVLLVLQLFAESSFLARKPAVFRAK